MCGIVGVLSDKRSHLNRSTLALMMQQIEHRGPDASDIFCEPDEVIALGHQRLSIVDLSSAGQQPMQSCCGRYTLIFNGEIYNHLKLRTQLFGSKAIQWKGHSDTETLLEYFCEFGLESTLTALKGMFAFAIWDSQNQELVLARDRFGEKPLYYGWQNGAFLFGSELKALRMHPGFDAGIDRVALALFVRRNYVPSPYSIYKNIFKLPAAHYLKISLPERTRLEPIPYWSLPAVAKESARNLFSGTESEGLEILDEKVGLSVESQMLSDMPIGALLSGGIDSSLVCALMQQCQSTPIDTFTIGFDNKNFNESEHAKLVARHIGSHHTELNLRPSDAMGLIPSLPQVYDEPFADSSQLPTILVMQLAKKHVSVALSGDGADEIFGGYNRYSYAPSVYRYFGSWAPSSRTVLATLLRLMNAETLNTLSQPFNKYLGLAQFGDKVHKLAGRLQHAGNIDELYESLVSQWDDVSLVVKLGPESLPDAKLLSDLTGPNDAVSQMMLMDSLTYLPDDILAKVDRAAMSVSLETRAPFLDHDLAEFAWTLPRQYKIANNEGKYLLRKLLYKYVPESLVNRPKIGFSVPLDEWLRGPLRDWAENLLSSSRLDQEGYFYAPPIRKAWADHISRKASNGYQLWSILMFQVWLEGQ